MKVLIADDEPVARQVLRELLEECPGIEAVGEAASGQEALGVIARWNPEVLLLDIHMPGVDGLGVARGLRPTPLPLVIFVTAYEQHALEAFDSGAVDYLLKPVRLERLRAALAKARAQLAGLTARQSPAGPPPRITGRAGEELHVVDTRDIVAFRASGGGATIITAAGRYTTPHSLKELEARFLPPRFRRIHRAVIINTEHLRSIAPMSSRRWLLRLSNGTEAIVSKRMAGVLRDATHW